MEGGGVSRYWVSVAGVSLQHRCLQYVGYTGTASRTLFAKRRLTGWVLLEILSMGLSDTMKNTVHADIIDNV